MDRVDSRLAAVAMDVYHDPQLSRSTEVGMVAAWCKGRSWGIVVCGAPLLYDDIMMARFVSDESWTVFYVWLKW